MTLASIDALPGLSDGICADLRAHFATVGFTPELVAAAELFFPGTLLGPRLPLVRWWLERRREHGAALARLFIYHDTLPETEARTALPAGLFEALAAAKVIGPASGGGVKACFIVTPIEGELWLLSDSLAAGANAVMGPSGGTMYLGRLMSQTFNGAALDIGCGAGSLALIAARRGARRSVGIDLNPRAIEIARFNARLNGLRAEFRAGDATAPVSDDRFDLVLSQPPFVVRAPDQPDITYLFGGPMGDELPRRFIGEIPRVLAPGGRALVLMQSAEREGEPLAARLRAAVAGAPVDLLVIGMTAPTPAVQASVFASYDDPSLGERYAVTVRRSLDHFDVMGIRAFDGAVVVLGRRSGDDVRDTAGPRAEERYTIGLKLPHQQYDAASLEQFLRGLDLISLPPDVFERARLRVSPHVRLVTDGSQVSDAAPIVNSGVGGAADENTVLRVEPPGIGTSWPVDRGDLQTLDAIGDADTLGAAIEAIARDRRVSATRLRDDILAFARNALVRGALLRDHDRGDDRDDENKASR